MNKLTMKIHDFDRQTGTITISYASDLFPNHETKLAYQIANLPNPGNLTATINEIALSGYHMMMAKERELLMRNNSHVVEEYASLVGQTLEYTKDELEGLNQPIENQFTDLLLS